ncbi:serine/threonine-protein phosphatase 7 long form homolog [Nicotiana sylvestris]|uniref:serine/threonine-protein phosphatase 7 long form homolog n=1 Tax=Nicotiana sylvestris TaxID=4096 RepID=UPI00388CE793
MHTFHLPIGEATIMLQDIEVLYRMSVDGLPVALPHGIRYMTHVQYLDLLQQLTGFRPQDETVHSGANRTSLAAIRQHLEILHPYITGETDDLHIHQYARLVLLLLFVGVLFPNTLGNLVSLRFLHHLQQLDALPQYNWGVAVLAYMYKHLCRASMGTQSDVYGFLPLLQVWAWERFLQLQPPLPPLPPDVPPPFLPLARRLSFGSSSSGAVDLSQAQASSQPITEATWCDAEDTTDAYIQEPDETMVVDGPTAPSTDPASPTDDHDAVHPHIKKRCIEDDPDSVSGREGMRLRPSVALKHKGCGTY